MYKRVYNFLTENNIIYDMQFGFRQKFSASHPLFNLTEKIRQALDEGYIGCGIFVDLQKAFDTVDHEILLSKLDYYGIHYVLHFSVTKIFVHSVECGTSAKVLQ